MSKAELGTPVEPTIHAFNPFNAPEIIYRAVRKNLEEIKASQPPKQDAGSKKQG